MAGVACFVYGRILIDGQSIDEYDDAVLEVASGEEEYEVAVVGVSNWDPTISKHDWGIKPRSWKYYRRSQYKVS